MEIFRIIIFLCLFIFSSSLKLQRQSEITYNEETGQYEFKLYFTNPSAIEDNVMFSFSEGVDEDGNEENVVFCEINPIERRLLRNLNIRELVDVEVTANCAFDVIKDPNSPIVFNNPEIRGVESENFEIEGDFKVEFNNPNSSTKNSIKTTVPVPSSNIRIATTSLNVPSTNIRIATTILEQKSKTTIPVISKTTIPKPPPISLLNPSIIIPIKNSIISEQITQAVATETPSNNTNFNSARPIIKQNSSGLSSGQILAIVLPCIALLIGALIAALLLKNAYAAAAAAPPMAHIMTPNYLDVSSLSKVNVPQEVTIQSLQPNPVQPQVTNINNPVVNRVFEPVTTQNAQIVPVQQVQTVPVQEITQVQVPATHTRGASSAIGFPAAPQ